MEIPSFFFFSLGVSLAPRGPHENYKATVSSLKVEGKVFPPPCTRFL